MSEDIVVIGKISSAHGIRGWVNIISYAQPRKNIFEYQPWLLKTTEGWQAVKVINNRLQGKRMNALLEDITNRNQAESLSGSLIGIFEKQLPELEQDEFYWRDLEGMQVVNLTEEKFGIVKYLMETGSNDVLVVQETSDGSNRERMIPFLRHVVIDVDKQKRCITVDWDADF